MKESGVIDMAALLNAICESSPEYTAIHNEEVSKFDNREFIKETPGAGPSQDATILLLRWICPFNFLPFARQDTKYGIPMNFLKVSDVILRRDFSMEFIFELKVTLPQDMEK